MSFAIIQTGGKQYKVQTSDIIKVEKLHKDKPGKIEFNEVLAYGDENTIEIGSPTVNGAKVEADLIKNSKERTVLIFKKRRRKNSRRKNGHRQQYSMVRINKIFSKDGAVIAEAEKYKEDDIKNKKLSAIKNDIEGYLYNCFNNIVDVEDSDKQKQLTESFIHISYQLSFFRCIH